MQDRLLIVGKKIGMTQLFDKNSCLLPVTVILAEPCKITQIKTKDKEGYNAVQFAYQEKNHVRKSVAGHLKKAEVSDKLASFREFTTENVDNFSLGQKLTVDLFKEGQKVDIIAQSKGKGFQGLVKRYDFAGGRASHGSMSHRRGGGFGHFRRMGHITKNQKMPGHMGAVRTTVQNLVIVKTVPEKGLILVKGSIPGFRGSFVMIRQAKRA
ncbi:MAG: 50S ribosomal protein L3 [Puniceicoccales bacterium]|jgi:large subunit ribosomal protein L3|nr:50S ribosomal protein L3 [Puniceicoccales bacterium]